MERQIKVFLDSNVIFSIAYTGKDRSRSYLFYELQALGILRVYLSNLVCKEAMFNIRKKKPDAERFLHELIDKSKVLEDIAAGLDSPEFGSLPQNDRIILATAVYNRIEFFVTGNEKDFSGLYRTKILGTTILRPADFLKKNF